MSENAIHSKISLTYFSDYLLRNDFSHLLSEEVMPKLSESGYNVKEVYGDITRLSDPKYSFSFGQNVPFHYFLLHVDTKGDGPAKLANRFRSFQCFNTLRGLTDQWIFALDSYPYRSFSDAGTTTIDFTSPSAFFGKLSNGDSPNEYVTFFEQAITRVYFQDLRKIVSSLN